MERKVKFKQWVLDELKSNGGFHKGHSYSIKNKEGDKPKAESYDIRFTNPPYLIIDDNSMTSNNEYRIIGPIRCGCIGYSVVPSHVEPYDEFPELDKAFEW